MLFSNVYFDKKGMRRLVIVDLDNTLVAAVDDKVYHIEEIGLEYDNLIVRPYAESFLTWLYNHFDIILFSTGTEEYVYSCISTYLLPVQTKVLHILHSKHADICREKYGKYKHSQYI